MNHSSKNTIGENHQNLLFEFTQGLDVDRRLYREEIKVQRAWLKQIFLAGV